MRALSILSLATVLLMANSAQARPGDVTVRLVAKVTRVGRPIAGLTVKVGDRITGSYKYNTRTPDTQRSNPKVGDYMHRQAAYGISLRVNGVDIKTDPAAVQFLIELVNDSAPDVSGTSHDHYLLRSYKNTSSLARLKVSHISWQLDDPTHSNLSTKKLTGLHPKLSNWKSPFGLTVTGCDVASVDETGECRESEELLFRAEVTSLRRRP